MPWNAQNFAKHCKGLTPAQYTRGAKAANAVLAETGNEGYAVRAGINAAKGRARKRLTPVPDEGR